MPKFIKREDWLNTKPKVAVPTAEAAFVLHLSKYLFKPNVFDYFQEALSLVFNNTIDTICLNSVIV